MNHFTVKDFDSFVNRLFGGFDLSQGTAETDQVWRMNILTMKGQKWKRTRSAMTPVFSSSKIRGMAQVMGSVSDELVEYIKGETRAGKNVDLSKACGKYSMETIASCIFGVRAGSFDSDGDDSPFVKCAYNLFSVTGMDMMKMIGYMTPGVRQVMDLLRIPINKEKETRFLMETAVATIRHRRENPQSRRRNDLIDLMLEAMDADENEDITEFVIIANAVLILNAAYDTTGATMAYALYQIAVNPDIQARLKNEITQISDHVLNADGTLDFSAIAELEYLDQVVQETLRMYTPFATHSRECTKDYVIPGTDVSIPRGTEVQIPIMGFHHDERFFPEPEKFLPERFSKATLGYRHPIAFMPFGHGPRNCIGIRFALLEIKIVIIKILDNFALERCSQTPETLTFAPGCITARPKERLWIEMKQID